MAERRFDVEEQYNLDKERFDQEAGGNWLNNSLALLHNYLDLLRRQLEVAERRFDVEEQYHLDKERFE